MWLAHYQPTNNPRSQGRVIPSLIIPVKRRTLSGIRNDRNENNDNNESDDDDDTQRHNSRFCVCLFVLFCFLLCFLFVCLFCFVSSLRRELSATRTLKWPCRNRVQITNFGCLSRAMCLQRCAKRQLGLQFHRVKIQLTPA